MNLKSNLYPTQHDIAAIAKGEVVVDTSALSPMESLKLGLAVADYKEANNLVEKDFEIDLDAVGKIVSERSKMNR